jgi:hypothetical protein
MKEDVPAEDATHDMVEEDMPKYGKLNYTVNTVDDVIKRLPRYFTVSVASKRNSGKTVLVSELIKRLLAMKKVDMVVVMSGSAHLNDDYDFLPKKLVMPFSERVLKNAWALQEKKLPKDRPHILFVLDDCLATPEAVRNTTVAKYYSLGRHVQSSFIIISQHTSVLLTPIIKGNSDIILWSKLNRGQLWNLWESTVNITRKDFVHLSETLGGIHYQFMLLDNHTHSTNPADFLDVIKAKPPS